MKVQSKINKNQSSIVLSSRLKNNMNIKSYAVLCVVIIILNLANIVLCNSKIANKIPKYRNDSSLIEARQLFEDSSGFVWSQFLEDYVLSQSSSSRTSKDLPFLNNGMASNEMTGSSSLFQMNTNMNGIGPMQNQQAPLSYHSSAYKRYIPTNNPNVYITKRIGEEVELEPHMRPPIKVVNPQFRPMTNQMLHHQQQQQQQQQQPGFLQSLFGFGSIGGNGGSGSINTTPSGPVSLAQQQQQQQQQQPQMRPHSTQHAPSTMATQNFRAVSENDLYLLGAIEKLVYRVDYLESRIRRSEQLIYYLMAGNNQKEVRDPCPTNFTRISDNCYYINSHQQVNWKTANSACKALNAHLAEFEKTSENEEIMAYLLNQPNHRGRDYWLGGLNPGLLWIWSNSAKPVNPNMNLTSIAMSQQDTVDVDNDDNTVSNKDNLTTSDGDDKKNHPTKETESNVTILNNTVEIKGQGRCLRLSYNTAKHSYIYYGQECTSRHHYICEYEDKTLDNKIKKISRDLKLNFLEDDFY